MSKKVTAVFTLLFMISVQNVYPFKVKNVRKLKGIKSVISSLACANGKLYYFVGREGLYEYGLRTGKRKKIIDRDNVNIRVKYRGQDGTYRKKTFTRIVNVFNPPYVGVSVSNSGKKLALSMALQSSDGYILPPNIFIMDIDTGNINQLMELKKEKYEYIEGSGIWAKKKSAVGFKWRYINAYFSSGDREIIFQRQGMKKEIGSYDIKTGRLRVFSDKDAGYAAAPLSVHRNGDIIFFNIVEKRGKLKSAVIELKTGKIKKHKSLYSKLVWPPYEDNKGAYTYGEGISYLEFKRWKRKRIFSIKGNEEKFRYRGAAPRKKGWEKYEYLQYRFESIVWPWKNRMYAAAKNGVVYELELEY